MNRIDSYEDLAEQIVNWIKDYYWDNDLGGLVVVYLAVLILLWYLHCVQEQVYQLTFLRCNLIQKKKIQNYQMHMLNF